MMNPRIGKNCPAILPFIVAACLSLVCTAFQASAQHRVNSTITITVKEGRYWRSGVPIMLFFKKTTFPQMAFWLEDTSGAFAATIYVTKRTAIQDWRALPFQKEQVQERPSTLPIWLFKHIRGGIHPIESCSSCHSKHRTADKSLGKDPILDAFTSATPEKGFTLAWVVPPELKPGRYIFCAEFNNSFDYNETFRKDLPESGVAYNDVNGQPSVLYLGLITIGNAASGAPLKLTAHGSPMGKNGAVFTDLNGITTARSIIESVTVVYTPGM